MISFEPGSAAAQQVSRASVVVVVVVVVVIVVVTQSADTLYFAAWSLVSVYTYVRRLQ